MDWLLVLSIAGAIGTVFTVFQVAKELWHKCNNKRSEKVKDLLYPIAIIILTAVSVHLATLNNELIEIRVQAHILRQQWPDYIGYHDSERSLGIVNGGLSFVEQFKDHIPVTVEQVLELAIEARGSCTDLEKWAACHTAAEGMMGLIDAIARDQEPRSSIG